MTMPDNPTATTEASVELVAAVRAYTRRELADVGLRLARGLAARFDAEPAGADRDALAAALAFAEGYAETQGVPVEPPPPGHPLVRLAGMARSPVIAALLEDLILLACLPEAHEGFATLCRLMHPARRALPTATLALHWLEGEVEAADGDPDQVVAIRDHIEDLLCHSPVAEMGLLRLHGDGPWHGRDLTPGAGLWAALMGRLPRLDDAELIGGYGDVPGLADWLREPPVVQAMAAIRKGLPCQLLLSGGDVAMRATRVRALLGALQAVAIRTGADALQGQHFRNRVSDTYTAAFAHQACLWLEYRADDAHAETPAQPLPTLDWALPVITSAASERLAPSFPLPLIHLAASPLPAVARRALWQSMLPQLGDQAGLLAARYPIDPETARAVVCDLALRQELDGRPLAVEQIGACLRARTSWQARPGIQRALPRADWSALLVPDMAQAQLRAAVQRVLQQITVLDDWGFAQGREERRGVRLLFFGPPGTGKTLAAEVMAHALGVDMLIVDLAALVSKWIGETEKNLAAVFEVAERSRALLLFDEADALFAKRTENQDAHDRYANLETAYLLQRLERYEGVAILTTNLRSNLDKAFTRRFEHIVEFPEPDAATREALWRLHLPAAAPLAADVSLPELAAWYPISGAQIKNAALAAAFGAAAAGTEIRQQHFLAAIEREYDKAGRAHPGSPQQTPWPAAGQAVGGEAFPVNH